jgi:hypothetical protein
MSNASTAAIAALILPILAKKIGVKVKIEKGAKRGKRALGKAVY